MVPSCRVGFLVNPVAGMGGAVGLKGTDGSLLHEAIKRGAKPVAPARAARFLLKLKSLWSPAMTIISAGGVMGCDYVAKSGIDRFLCLEEPRRSQTTRDDTIMVVKKILGLGVDLVTFVGGDGTARDVLEACGSSVPILGIPSGVKVYSSVFAVSPEAAAEMVSEFCRGESRVEVGEVVDINEELLQQDTLVLRAYGKVLTLASEGLRVPTKEFGSSEDAESIAEYFVEELCRPGVLYILGPGSTTKAIADKLGVSKTLLGFDAILDGRLIKKDLTESDLKELVAEFKDVYVVLSIVGGQGYLIGRGNQQLSPDVLRTVGRDRLIIVSSRNKLIRIRHLLIDSGDPEVDRELSGYYKVITGYGEVYIIKALPASEPESLRPSQSA